MINIIKKVSLKTHMETKGITELKVYPDNSARDNFGAEYKLWKNVIGNISKHSFVYYYVPTKWADCWDGCEPLYLISNT
jgi:hypothetical protein